MTEDLYVAATGAFPALSGLTPEMRARFDAEARLMIAEPGAVMFEPGAPCRAFPVVLEGAIRVARIAENGREIVLYRVVPGEPCIVTTQCLLGRGEYPARGSVETPLIAVALSGPLFDALLNGHPPFLRALMALFSERIVALMTLVEEVAFQRLDVRLANLLLARGAVINATHQAIAEDLGSVREIVSRLLKQFEARGWVVLARERIEVMDPGALRAYAGGAP